MSGCNFLGIELLPLFTTGMISLDLCLLFLFYTDFTMRFVAIKRTTIWENIFFVFFSKHESNEQIQVKIFLIKGGDYHSPKSLETWQTILIPERYLCKLITSNVVWMTTPFFGRQNFMFQQQWLLNYLYSGNQTIQMCGNFE